MVLKLVSLFDGIGGFPLAFERAGVQTVATVELDTAAAAVSHRHFPDATQFQDVTEVSAGDIRSTGFVPNRGILTAGWPCQDFSVAGRRAGLAGARSGLWWQVVRLLADLRPRWFVGENVPGLLSSVCEPECPGGCMRSHGGAMGSVLGSLAELGYGVAYRVLDAQHFGVPQRRQRVVIVGHLGTPFGAAAQVLFEPESGGGDSAAGGSPWPHIAPCLEAGANTTGGTRPSGTTAESPVVVPALVARYSKGTDSDATDALIVSALTANGVGTCGADDNQAQAGHIVTHPLAVRGREGDARITSDTVIRRLTELECERLQGYPDGWADGQRGAARYRQLGNSIAVPVFEWVAQRIVAVDAEGRYA